ncbi:MAG: helix-turn-helix domain-containing protein [Bacteroidota bacterium]
MRLENQLLFFFSGLGSFNGLFMTTYYAFLMKGRNRASKFLAALILVLSIRILKSTFLFFYPDIPELFIQVGLTACALIGPFLFLYIKESTSPEQNGHLWILHVIAPILVILIFRYFYPYSRHDKAWYFFIVWVVYVQWVIYVMRSGYLVKDTFKTLFTRSRKLTDHETWLVNVIIGTFIVWLAYRTVRYTSYIVGALSFSFIFYLLILTWLYRKRNAFFVSGQPKYANKKIGHTEAEKLIHQLTLLFSEAQLHLNPDLKLSDVAEALEVSDHRLSQLLNDNLTTNFSDFINTFRIRTAEEMIQTKDQLTLEAIGKESGFRSNSTFYAAFKKLKGTTPAQFKKKFS